MRSTLTVQIPQNTSVSISTVTNTVSSLTIGVSSTYQGTIPNSTAVSVRRIPANQTTLVAKKYY
jgi:hypothetical protein